MNKVPANEGSRQAVSLIEEQLQTLAISVALIRRSASPGGIDSDATAGLAALVRKGRPHDTGSGGARRAT